MAHADARRCVLVIDDDPRSLTLMTIVLGKAGYRVVTACDGMEGLERLSAERPDIVLVDLMMPRMDGLEFCRRVRQSPGLGALPVALFTAMASSDIRAQAQSAGVSAVLVKPFERLALLDDLARMLEQGGSAPTDRGDDSPRTDASDSA